MTTTTTYTTYTSRDDKSTYTTHTVRHCGTCANCLENMEDMDGPALPCTGMKIAVVGDPHCGKSVFINAVATISDTTVIPACPDGEGQVYQELLKVSRSAADNYKQAFKGTFTAQFVSSIVAMLTATTSGAWLVDVGGKRTAENAAILSACDAVVILYKSEADLAAWQAYTQEIGIKVLSAIQSNMLGHDSDTTCSGLNRGANVTSKPAVKAVAALLS